MQRYIGQQSRECELVEGYFCIVAVVACRVGALRCGCSVVGDDGGVGCVGAVAQRCCSLHLQIVAADAVGEVGTGNLLRVARLCSEKNIQRSLFIVSEVGSLARDSYFCNARNFGLNGVYGYFFYVAADCGLYIQQRVG